MTLRFGNTTVTRVIYNKPSSGISRELDVLRYARGGSTTTVFERNQNPVEFSGAYNHVATYSGSNTIVGIGVRVLPNGRVQHMYITAGQFGSGTHTHNMGGWIRDFPISESAGANYEVQFQHYMQDPTGWYRLDTFRDFYREASSGTYQMSVRVRERGNTSNTAVRGYQVGANKV